MGNILAECGNNLRAVKNHLIRECHLPKSKNLSYTIKNYRCQMDSGIHILVKFINLLRYMISFAYN